MLTQADARDGGKAACCGVMTCSGALRWLAGTSGVCARCAAGGAADMGASAQESAWRKPGRYTAWCARRHQNRQMLSRSQQKCERRKQVQRAQQSGNHMHRAPSRCHFVLNDGDCWWPKATLLIFAGCSLTPDRCSGSSAVPALCCATTGILSHSLVAC